MSAPRRAPQRTEIEAIEDELVLDLADWRVSGDERSNDEQYSLPRVDRNPAASARERWSNELTCDPCCAVSIRGAAARHAQLAYSLSEPVDRSSIFWRA